MPFWMKATGIGGSLLVIIALVIALLKSLITFVGFLTFVFKVLVILAFIAVIVGVGFLVLKGISEKRRSKS